MDKQLLEQEAMERYPFKPSDSITIRNSYADRQIGYIAGATSSSTVKNLEREVEGLKGLDNAWPLNDVLHELKEASRTLLDKHNYDGTRHEEILHCIKRAEEIQQCITKTVNNDSR